MNDAPRKGSLFVIFLTVFIDLLGFGIVLPLLPIYGRQFPSIDQHGLMLGMLMASFSLMQFIFAPMWGRLSDSIGRRPVLIIGLAGSVVFYTLFAIATMQLNLVLLFVSRIGAGISGATISTAQAYIADSTTLEKRPKGMALIGMAFGLGFTLGPAIGYLAVPSGPDAPPGSMPGFVAAGLSLVAFVLAIFILPESRTSSSQHNTHRKMFDWQGFKTALQTPSIGLLLFAVFVCVFSFANFETTLSLLMKENFKFSYRSVMGTFCYIGFTLSVVQGGIVRRLAGKVPESRLATIGALLQVVGLMLIYLAASQESLGLFWLALTIMVAGFSLMQPSLSSLISRRSDPETQGRILGVSQSVNSMARIVGSAVSIPLFQLNYAFPYTFAAVLMLVGTVLVVYAGRAGKDFVAE
jgi:MFS family permease